MEARLEKRIIEIDVINIDGEDYDIKDILKFFDEACDFSDTIGKGDNWSSDYLYFYPKEKNIEDLLVKKRVIRLNGYYKKYHKDLREGNRTLETCKKYHLGKGYDSFYRKVWDVLNEYYELKREK